MRISPTRFLATLICCAVLLSAVPLQADISATVNVDAANVRSVMSPLGLGMHTSQYYNAMGNPQVDDRIEEAGVTALRFGGGGYADVNHWSVVHSGSTLTGKGFSPWFGQAGNYGYVGPGSDFGSFVRLLDQVDNGQAVVTVNYGSALKVVGNQSVVPDFGGQPKEAAAWVAYANSDASIYGTPSDIVIGVDQQGNDWKTAGYWAKLRASTAAEFQTWAQADGVFDSRNSFLAINRDDPVGIKHWEIGNETFGTGYYGGGNGYSVDYDLAYGSNRDDNANLSPAQYGQEVVQYSQLMKSIDPTIKIGAVLATPPDDYGWSYADLNDSGSKQSNEPYWNDEVLSQSGVSSSVDFVMVHWYPWAGNTLMDEDGDGQNDDVNTGATLLNYPRQKINQMINGSTAGLDSGTNRGIRDSLTAHNLPNAEIMITEFRYNNPENIQAASRPAADSIFVADAYASWLELGVTSVQYLELMGKDFLSDDLLTRGSAFYGVSMVDALVEPGESLVNATTTNNSVRTHAALQDDGSIAVMLMNLHRTDTANVAVNIANIELDVNGVVYTLTNGTNFNIERPGILGNAFNVSLPPRSISTYIINAAPMLAGDFDDDGDVDGRDFLEWQLGNSPNPLSAEDLADWQTNYGTVPELAAALTIPEPTCGAISTLMALLSIASRFPRGQKTLPE